MVDHEGFNKNVIKSSNDLQTPLLLQSDNGIEHANETASVSASVSSSIKDLASAIQCTPITNDSSADLKDTLAGLAGNMIEWYDFSVFGYFADIIGDVMFPPQEGNAAIIESFIVFGSAFLMRPLGALLFGYIGDKYGAKRALEISLFMMAIPTFAMGCLPTYDQIGWGSVVLLSVMRLLQGISVGGQLTSSFVFTLEKRDQKEWGIYGSIVMISCAVGSLIGSILGYTLRSTLSDDQLETFGWRIPFLLGIFLCIPGYYLKYHSKETLASSSSEEDKVNPIEEAFKSPENRRSVLAVALVTTLHTGSFYLTFIWMPIFMEDLIDPPQKQAFLITTLVILLSLILFKPIPGMLSDKYGTRKKVMTPGAIGIAILGPLTIYVASTRNTAATFFVHLLLGMSLAFYAAPLPAWLLESFPDHRTRLTCVSVGYNLATSTIGGFSPLIATLMCDNIGLLSPGILYVIYAIISMFGLHCVAAKINSNTGDDRITSSQSNAQLSALL